MKYLIIGLGNFGKTLAEDLTDNGNEVIGIDNDERKIEDVKDRISLSYIMDATEAGGARCQDVLRTHKAVCLYQLGLSI